MTKPRDYFTGKQEEFKRSEVQIAPYNPRKISPQQKATLKRSIRKYGVVGGITVNKQTMTIVGGNLEFTKAAGMELDARVVGEGIRSQRYAAIVDDGVVVDIKVEEKPWLAEASSAGAICGLAR